MPKPPKLPPTSDEQDDALAPFAEALRERVPSRAALLAEAKAQTARQRRRGKQAATGGLLVLLLAAGLWFFDPAWHTEDIYTAIGQHRTTHLADGSTVILNTNTHLRIETRWRSRQLELVRGEATFTVAHQPKPFIVRSQSVQIRDIGTVFNIRSDSRGVVVSVVEGQVEVSNEAARPRFLEANQQIQANRERISITQHIDPAIITAWQRGKLHFDGTPLREVVADLQRYRQAPIRLNDARLDSLRVSGEYDTDAIESLINLLPVILPVSLARSSDGSVVIHGLR